MWSRCLIAGVVISGSLLVLQAQELKVPGGKGPPKDKGPKGELFKGPAFGGPLQKELQGGLFEALRDKKVQDELELVPEQRAELQRIASALAAKLEPALRELKDLPKEEHDARMLELRKEFSAAISGVQAELDKVLLPHQRDRLRQAALQLQLKKEGAANALLSPALLAQLGVNEKEAARLREALLKIEEEYKQKLRDLQLEARDRALAEFSPAQREQLQKLLGPALADGSKPSRGNAPLKRPPTGD